MQAAVSIDDPARIEQRQRLAICTAVSALGVLLIISTLRWPAGFDLARLAPPELELRLLKPADVREPERERPKREALPTPQRQPESLPQPETPPLPRSETPALPQPAIPATRAEPQEGAAAPERPTVAEPEAATTEAPVDWYVELEQAAAAVGDRAAEEPKSMDPEFDERRRIAASRYAKPRTNKPPPPWKEEKDPYGRTLLRRGNSYMILDDPSGINRYAFETFERHMIFFTEPFGRRRPKNLPWVETIRARYDYMREPDELPPLKAGLTSADLRESDEESSAQNGCAEEEARDSGRVVEPVPAGSPGQGASAVTEGSCHEDQDGRRVCCRP
ncbi:MAG TPA: hypothetical protein VE175_04755 [Woeseiaceae bacterium]|nr:hypothetical protein [Woeseiaceae bacterium]